MGSERQARTPESIGLGTAPQGVSSKLCIVTGLWTAGPDKQTKPETFPASISDKPPPASIVALEYFTITPSSERQH